MTNEPTAAQPFQAAVGERVYLWRLVLMMGRATLAKKADLSVDYVYRLEQGWANPRISTLHKVAAALGTTVAELLGNDG